MLAHPVGDSVTPVEILGLTRPYGELAPRLAAAVHRLENEGIQALLSMQFYRNVPPPNLAP